MATVTDYLYNNVIPINSEQEYTVNFTTNATEIAFGFGANCYNSISDWNYYYSTYSCPFVDENTEDENLISVYGSPYITIMLPENINDSVSGTLIPMVQHEQPIVPK